MPWWNRAQSWISIIHCVLLKALQSGAWLLEGKEWGRRRRRKEKGKRRKGNWSKTEEGEEEGKHRLKGGESPVCWGRVCAGCVKLHSGVLLSLLIVTDMAIKCGTHQWLTTKLPHQNLLSKVSRNSKIKLQPPTFPLPCPYQPATTCTIVCLPHVPPWSS